MSSSGLGVSECLAYRVNLNTVRYQPGDDSSTSLQSPSRSSSPAKPLVLRELQHTAGQEMDARVALVGKGQSGDQFKLDGAMVFTAVDPAVVTKHLDKMKQTAKLWNLGAVVSLVGAVVVAGKTYVNYAALDKTPFWMRAAGAVALVVATFFFGNKGSAADTKAKGINANYGLTVQQLADQRALLLGVESTQKRDEDSSSAQPKAPPTLFATPGLFRGCLGIPELQAVFSGKVAQWLPLLTPSSSLLSFGSSSSSAVSPEDLLFKQPTPLSRDVQQFYLENDHVRSFDEARTQFETIKLDYARILPQARDRPKAVGGLVQRATTLFTTTFSQVR